MTKNGTEAITNKTISNSTLISPTLTDGSTSYTLTVYPLIEDATIATSTNLKGYAKAVHFHEQYLTQHQSLADYVTKTGNETLTNKTITNPTLKDNTSSYALTVPTLTEDTTIATAKDLTGYAVTGHTHSQYLTQHQSLTNYVTLTGTQELTNKTLKTPIIAAIKNGSYSLSIPTLTANATIATQAWVTGQNYLTQHQSLTDYVTKTGTQELTNKTLTTPVIKSPKLRDSSHEYNLTVPSLSANAVIATQAWVEAKNYLTSHQSLTDYVTLTGSQELTNKTITAPTIKNPNLRDSSHTYNLTVPTLTANAVIATQAWVTGKNYLTSHQSLTDYVTKTGTETLTNKTLSSPVITHYEGSFTLTIDMPDISNYTVNKTTTLATALDIDKCVKTSGNQTVGGTKTFSAAPKLSTNTLTNSSGNTITLPSAAGTLVADTSSPASSTNLIKAIINIIYPVGIVCFFYSTEKPDDKFPGTTWEILSTGKYVQTRAQATASSTGGSTTSGSTTISINQMPAHTHVYYINQGTETVTNTISFSGSGHLVKNTNATNGLAVVTSSIGGTQGHTHTINPPYITLSAWRRKT